MNLNNDNNQEIKLGDILVSRQKLNRGQNLIVFVEVIEEKPMKRYRVRSLDKDRDMVYVIPVSSIGETWDLVT